MIRWPAHYDIATRQIPKGRAVAYGEGGSSARHARYVHEWHILTLKSSPRMKIALRQQRSVQMPRPSVAWRTYVARARRTSGQMRAAGNAFHAPPALARATRWARAAMDSRADAAKAASCFDAVRSSPGASHTPAAPSAGVKAVVHPHLHAAAFFCRNGSFARSEWEEKVA